MKKKIKFYTKDETNKIVEMFMSKEKRGVCEKYAKSIGRTFDEIKQKAYYEFTKTNVTARQKRTNEPYKPGQINFIVENWRNLSKANRKKHAESLGRTYQAIEKMYYKNRKPVKVQKEGVITVTHVNKARLEQKSAIIKVGDVVMELPNTTKSISINGNTLEW